METLGEMFPNYSQSDLGMVLNLVNHDLQRAVQILLLDNGEQEIVKGLVKPGGQAKKSSPGGEDKIDDKKGLKERLMARCGYLFIFLGGNTKTVNFQIRLHRQIRGRSRVPANFTKSGA